MRDTVNLQEQDGLDTWVPLNGGGDLGHRQAFQHRSVSIGLPVHEHEDGSFWIVANGEIYNHAKIRAEFKQIGKHHGKMEHSDTEVIRHIFEHGESIVLTLLKGSSLSPCGMNGCTTRGLSTTESGVKPLYYSIHRGRYMIALGEKIIRNLRAFCWSTADFIR